MRSRSTRSGSVARRSRTRSTARSSGRRGSRHPPPGRVGRCRSVASCIPSRTCRGTRPPPSAVGQAASSRPRRSGSVPHAATTAARGRGATTHRDLRTPCSSSPTRARSAGGPAGAGPFGHLDLAGNAWEWTSSLLHAYPYDPRRRSRGGRPRPACRARRGVHPRPGRGALLVPARDAARDGRPLRRLPPRRGARGRRGRDRAARRPGGDRPARERRPSARRAPRPPTRRRGTRARSRPSSSRRRR